MRRAAVVCLVLGVASLSVGSADAQPFGRGDQQAARYGWLSSLSEGKAQAKRSGKPIMVVVRCVP